MDFTPTPEQTAARELAAEIFGDLSTPERLADCGGGTDAELWKALCTAGLPGAVAETGLLGLVLMLEEQGRTTAQVPFAASCVYGLLAVGAHGSVDQRARLLPALRDGSAIATGALPARPGGVRAVPPADGTGRLTGSVPVVPWLRAATHVLVPDGPTRTLWLLRTDAPGVRRDPVETTAPWSAGRLTLDDAPAECLGPGVAGRVGSDAVAPQPPAARPYGPYADVLAIARTAFAGLQAGVCAGSLARAVSHTTTREQFGRPLSTHQGVLLRAADAYMDTEAIRLTAYEAAWRRDAGLDAGEQALTAAWWAAEAGTRVVHTGQHLHGGIGADLDHPVHRHFLWGRQLAGYLGSGAEVLEELGQLLTSREARPSQDARDAHDARDPDDGRHPDDGPAPQPRQEAAS
ncbi:acyl-CoA/acyl-ACP dehydrogenase [Streptomyces sioyaensis]|uniref:Acyl-CoA dehydrogenase n=1 Tax=Streptomyces sioyaensis TaxID=67364 RepID=A0A4Q1QJF2_9ACTN|nr:acyl-CoA dehydrogenase family protein [Streptomyces sioyaensis]MBM4794581.1 acyl-CoA/acyl-ACP dehydrogenase [Streptomyces sioyaensis]RXS59978.1 acyl-CoA dehydrogenase [Streptomyces sioyaensis]